MQTHGEQEQKKEEFLKLNPFGQLPVLQLPNNGPTIYESGAILLYLSETYGELSASSKGGPGALFGGQSTSPSPLDKAKIAKWVFWANSSLSNKITQGAGRKGSPGWRVAMAPLLIVLDQHLAENAVDSGFIMGGKKITAADIAVASLLLYTPIFHQGEYTLLKDYPNVVDYIERMYKRPAYSEAYGDQRVAIIEDHVDGYRNPSKASLKKSGAWGSFF